MGAHNQGGGLVHAIEVEGHIGMEGIAAGEHIRVGTCLHEVAVLFLLGGEAGVEGGIDLLGKEHPDVRGQVGVERDGKLVRCHAGFRVEVGHLGPGVDAGVRAAAALEAGMLAGHLQDGLLHYLLHGHAVRLGLPAHVVRAVVCDYGPDAPHHRSPGTNPCTSKMTAMKASVTSVAIRSLTPSFS